VICCVGKLPPVKMPVAKQYTDDTKRTQHWTKLAVRCIRQFSELNCDCEYRPYCNYNEPSSIAFRFLTLSTRGSHIAQRDRATRYLSWNLANWWRIIVRKIPFEKACYRWMTLKVTQGHQSYRHSIGQISLLISDL